MVLTIIILCAVAALTALAAVLRAQRDHGAWTGQTTVVACLAALSFAVVAWMTLQRNGPIAAALATLLPLGAALKPQSSELLSETRLPMPLALFALACAIALLAGLIDF